MSRSVKVRLSPHWVSGDALPGDHDHDDGDDDDDDDNDDDDDDDDATEPILFIEVEENLYYNGKAQRPLDENFSQTDPTPQQSSSSSISLSIALSSFLPWLMPFFKII